MTAEKILLCLTATILIGGFFLTCITVGSALQRYREENSVIVCKKVKAIASMQERYDSNDIAPIVTTRSVGAAFLPSQRVRDVDRVMFDDGSTMLYRAGIIGQKICMGKKDFERKIKASSRSDI